MTRRPAPAGSTRASADLDAPLLARLAADVMTRSDILATFSEEPDALTRTFLSRPMQAVHSLLRTWCDEAGAQGRVDHAGNFVATYPAARADAPVLLVGSHLDTVRNAGRYDGTLGVLLGVALVTALARSERRLPFRIDVVGFSEEEGVRFRTPFLGSSAVTGTFDPTWLELEDDSGMRMREVVRRFGLDPARISEAAYDPERTLGYVEVHIEQGPRLAHLGRPLGVVRAIVGQRRARLSFRGHAGHAGTAPMNLRRDALVGAAAFVTAAARLARDTPELTATVGQLEVEPGVVNVIPARATLSLDLRHPDDAHGEAAYETLLERARDIARSEDLELDVQPLVRQPATPLDEAMSRRLLAAAGEDAPWMTSGAGHDAMVLAPFTPSALLFVRSPNGLSHHPDETVDPRDVLEALETLARFVLAEGADRAA